MSTLSVVELAKQLKERTVKATDLVEKSCSKIKHIDPKVDAFLTLEEEKAMAAAEKVDADYDKGNPLPSYAGIPIGIKDNINIAQEKTTCSSRILENFISPYNATVIEKINQAGLISVGKLNLDEFAMGSSTENSAFKTTKNPWDLTCVPGGSSGGSAAAVAADMVPWSLGSDTGGSIRQPAAFCGVIGLKPTYGRVSRYGLVAFASSLDQIGPITRHVEDAAALLEIISGEDSFDATSVTEPVPNYLAQLNPDIKGLKIAVPEQLLSDAIHPEIKESTMAALDYYAKQGADYSIVSMDAFDASIATYYVIAPAEASANLARFDGIRYSKRAEQVTSIKECYVKSRGEGFGEEVKRRILIGTFVLSSGYYDAFYLKAQKARTFIKQSFDKIFADYDVVISPTTPTTAFEIGEKTENPMDMYMSDLATIPANMAGLPGISHPCGFDSNGRPIGLQIVGKAFDEQTLLNMAYNYQQSHQDILKVPEGMS